MKDDHLYLVHILECIERIEAYTSAGREVFLSNEKDQDAVLRNLHTLTESTQRLSDTLKIHCTDVDWRAIAGFRNVLVHDYLGIDLEQVWKIVEQDLPTLKEQIQQLLNSFQS